MTEEKQKIVVEVEDLTWNNVKEKMIPVFEIERKLGFVYEIYVGLSDENFDRLMQTSPYLNFGEMGAVIVHNRIHHTICGFPIRFRRD